VAHNRALKELKGRQLNGYTVNVVKQIGTLMVPQQLENIHCWFKAKEGLPIISASAASVKRWPHVVQLILVLGNALPRWDTDVRSNRLPRKQSDRNSNQQSMHDDAQRHPQRSSRTTAAGR
jgi:hypothetical protein